MSTGAVSLVVDTVGCVALSSVAADKQVSGISFISCIMNNTAILLSFCNINVAYCTLFMQV
jgi:hypothetical protein